MKKITYLILGMMIFSSQITIAQEQLDTVYIKAKKADSHTYIDNIRYYYYPNLQAYFDTKKALYIYKKDGSWITGEKIDPSLRGYSLKNGAHVMIKGYTGDEPYTLLDEHKQQYPADFSTKRKPQNTVALKD